MTGHTGFKGSWLTLLLTELGAKVVGLALPENDTQSLYKDARISSLLAREYIQDIREYEKTNDAIYSQDIDYVFHLAAIALVRKSVREPIESFTTNITGTANVVLSALSSTTVMGITVATTDKVYKNLGTVYPFKESDKLGGDDPYSASKAAAEFVVCALANSNNPRSIPVTTVRAGNVIGGGDWGEERLVPDLIRAINSSSVLNIRNPNATRPWQYILDCLYGYLLVAQAQMELRSDFPKAVNIGPKHSLSVSELIDLFAGVLGKPIEYEVLVPNIHEHNNLVLDSSLAERVLGWQPSFTTSQSVVQTATWYRKFMSGSDAQQLMYDEILSYKVGKW